jgi:hypothetical protein
MEFTEQGTHATTPAVLYVSPVQLEQEVERTELM